MARLVLQLQKGWQIFSDSFTMSAANADIFWQTQHDDEHNYASKCPINGFRRELQVQPASQIFIWD